jgi:hypothetical protein
MGYLLNRLQNIESKGLIGKIFRNKDLGAVWKPMVPRRLSTLFTSSMTDLATEDPEETEETSTGDGESVRNPVDRECVHTESLRLLKSWVKVVRHKVEEYFC